MERELEIINKLKTLSLEMSKQDNRATAKPFWVDKENNAETFSFFESDVDYSKNNFVKYNGNAKKMNELRELLLELGDYI